MIRFRAFSPCILAAALFADPATSQVAIGVHGGMSVPRLKLSGIDVRGEQPRTGPTAGASVTLPVRESLAVRLDVSFLRKGASWADQKLGDVTARVDYVQLTSLGKVSFPLYAPRVSLHLLAGAAVARETGCEVKVEYALHPITLEGECSDEEAPVHIPTRATDFSLVGGAGVHLSATGGVAVSLDLLYSRGLRSMSAGERDWTVHHRGMRFQAGLAFSSG